MDSSSFESESGKAPKKPSMMARVKAMNPNQYKKGGKIAHKDMGGAMPMAAPSAAPMAAMGQNALDQMTPEERNARAMQVRKALTGMKKGGSADSKAIKKLEKELHHHESMPMSKAHKKAMGGTIEGNAKKFAKTKMHDGDKTDRAHGTGEVTEGKRGGYATGGAIPADSNKGGKDYYKTVMHTATKDKANGTGGIKVSNAGGYKKGGTIEGGDWENRPANTAKKGVTGTSTGEVEESNAGGYKRGGMASKKAYATGGDVVDDGKAVKMPKHFVSRPVANSLQSGTFKRGGNVKHNAEGGRMPLKGHPYHDKSEDELKFIIKDANEAARAMKGHSPKSESKYLDQVNDASTVLHHRKQKGYSEEAVNKSIASSNRSGQKIGGKESKAIHSLLKGRY
jgi:hypothetical protein